MILDINKPSVNLSEFTYELMAMIKVRRPSVMPTPEASVSLSEG
jgi:hypothetical protein